MLLHGVVRLRALEESADGMVKLFGGTPMPEAIVRPFALTLPFVEAGIGLLVLAGLWTRGALITGGLLMAALVFGTALRSDWNGLAIQMLYAAIYAALLATLAYNVFSIDGLRRR
jgi:thiosulfate dehydrogenase (quinone) large subunit